MKKHIILIAIIGLFLLMLPLMAGADTVASGTCGVNLTWAVDDANVLTISGTGEMNNFSLLAYGRTTAPWFDMNISEVLIETGTMSIGNYAFYGCKNLTNVSLPAGLIYIGDNAFSFCEHLLRINLPSSVERVGNEAFWACTSISEIYLDSISSWFSIDFENPFDRPNYDTVNPCHLYVNNNEVTDIVIPDGEERISAYTFHNLEYLTSVIIPSGVTAIDRIAFSGCHNLSHIFIPDGVEIIGDRAFEFCNSLERITLPEGLSSIGNDAFYGCSKLTNIMIPESVSSIGNHAFYSCTGGIAFCTTDENKQISFGYDPFSGLEIYCYMFTAPDLWCSQNGIEPIYLDDLDSIRIITFPPKIRVAYGETKVIDVNVFPNFNEEITWSSSNSSIVTVDNGVATAVGFGTAMITATVGNTSTTTTIETYIQATSFTFSESEIWLQAKDNVQLTISAYEPENASAELTWESSDTSLANVDSNGYITTIKPGDVTISATTETGISRECLIHLTYPVTNVSIEPQTAAIFVEETIALTATVTTKSDSFANKLVTFNSSDETVARVDSEGFVVAIHPGTVTITATSSNGKSASAEITIICRTHLLTAHAKVDSTCTAVGTEAYWTCDVCGKLFTDEEATIEIEAPVEIPALGHDDPMAHTAAVAATCTAAGNTEYWHCTKCDKYFSDAAAEHEIALADTVIAALGHDPVHHDAQAPTCTEIGWDAYETCTRCDYTTYEEIPALDHKLVHHEAKVPTDIEEGWDEYDTCEQCDYSTQHILTSDMFFLYSPTPTCTTDGMAKYICEQGDQGLHYHNLVIKAPGHMEVTDAAVPATCTETGLTEGSHCSVCGEVLVAQEVIPATGHDLTAYNINGITAYWRCSVCGQLFADAEGMNELISGTCGADLTWTLDNQGTLIIYGTGDMSSPTWNIDDIAHVIVREGVTNICYKAFSGCTALTDVELSDSVARIGSYAFSDCINLSNISFGNSLRGIEYYAFSNCISLTSVILPEGISISREVFNGCRNLKTITIPDSYFPRRKDIDDLSFFGGLTGTIVLKIDDLSIAVDMTDIVDCGKCGDHAYWFLGSGKLSIYGFGAMDDYDRGYGYASIATMPWANRMYDIKEFIVHEGITRIGSYTVCSISQTKCNNTFYFPSSLISISGSAFYTADGADVYYIPNGYIQPGNYGGYRFNWHKPGGECGVEANWYMESIDTVVVSGPGVVSGCAWPYYIKNVSTLVVTESVSGMSANALNGLDHLQRIVFLGNPPALDSTVFSGRTINAYYMHGKSGWMEATYAEYGGDITWQQSCSWNNDNLSMPELIYHDSHLPTCTEAGNVACWICNTCGRGFTNQDATDFLEESEYVIPPLGHNWAEPVYEWSADNTSVTATRVCLRDAAHVETETKKALWEIAVPATCDEMGTTMYTVMFDHQAFEDQTKTLTDILPLGHDWVAATYVWAEDNSSVTANRVCSRDDSHTETETVIPIMSIAQSPTEIDAGSTLFTAVFKQEDFEEQSRIVEGDIPALNDMKMLVLPADLITIGEEAFSGLNCEAILIPDGCETIESKAFAYCPKLIYVRIPASVTDIFENAFEGCPQIRVDMID